MERLINRLKQFRRVATRYEKRADFQTRDAAAIIRHWHLVMLAFTFSLLTEAPPAGWVRTAEPEEAVGKKSGPRIIWQETLRRVRAWLCPWAQIGRYWQSWSHAPPPELQALLAHVAHSRPLDAPT
jgi:hypothetical protein